MKNHFFWMAVICSIPLLLIFFAPAMGITSDTWIFTFIILMFAVHLLIPMRHEDHKHGLSNENLRKEEGED